MKKLISIALTLMLSGCYQTVFSTDIDTAVEYCKDRAGVLEISATFTGLDNIMCKNGDKTTVYKARKSNVIKEFSK
jgi:hypothetical protein